jgi:hypothetical protein
MCWLALPWGSPRARCQRSYTTEAFFVAYFFSWMILLHEFHVFVRGYCPALANAVKQMLVVYGDIPPALTKGLVRMPAKKDKPKRTPADPRTPGGTP